MAYKLGVLVLHGMGEQKEDFADPFVRDVRKRLERASEAVCFEPVWWASVLQQRETDLLGRLPSPETPLDWRWLRRLVMHYLADAVAYQRVPTSDGRQNTYEEIHAVVGRSLHRLRDQLRRGAPPDAREAPLVVVAHSLGSHIASNYLWDLQHPRPDNFTKPVADNPFERAETLAGMVTFGCNIPLFTLAHKELVPIDFPSPTLAEHFPPGTQADRLAKAARWQNFYDKDDVLGYPLQGLSPQYGQRVEDRAINSGNPLTHWNPLSHNEYWSDNDVIEPVARLIKDLLDLV